MIYVDSMNNHTVHTTSNLHPDVREHLWMRSTGAYQIMDSYAEYPSGVNGKTKDYYTALEESPNPPNPSVGTIKADQTRIHFDLDVT